jgi:hypothetical protein
LRKPAAVVYLEHLACHVAREAVVVEQRPAQQ